MNYEDKIQRELAEWEQKMFKPPGWLERTSKTIGNRINHWIPPKVHNIITTTIRSIVRTALFGAEYTPSRAVQRHPELEAADQEANALFALYQKLRLPKGSRNGGWRHRARLGRLSGFHCDQDEIFVRAGACLRL